jgi:glycerol-3-phosphate O-acyltransferase
MPEFLAAAHVLVQLLRAHAVRLTASLVRNEASNFKESLAWLEAGGLVERLVDSGGAVLHAPVDKRLNLDFYKNNTIHFFLLPALLTRALLAEVPLSALRDHVTWWLDLYRWEFPLPERDALARELASWVAYYREHGALEGDALVVEHPIARATSGILDNFREAYQIAARTVSAHTEWPIAQKVLVQRMQRQFTTGLLLGELVHPEGNSMITFGNALSRLTELGHVTVQRRGRGGREQWIDRGPAFDRLPELIRYFGT